MSTPIIGYHNKRGVSLSELAGEEKVVTAPAPIEELHGLEASIPNEIIDRFITDVQEQIMADGKDQLLEMSSDAQIIAQQRDVVLRTAQMVAARTQELRVASPNAIQQLLDATVADIVGIGPLDPLLDDADVTEIIARWTEPVLVDRHRQIQATNLSFRSSEQLLRICNRIARVAGRKVDASNPLCDAWLLDGSRAHIALPPASPYGPCLTIRKFDHVHRSLTDLVVGGSLSEAMKDFLISAVHAKVNILISGATGTGKTTLLRALAMEIPKHEYIVTIEDTDELRLRQHNPLTTPLLYRPPSATGQGEITHRDLLKTSLRMRPDRIIVGEVRGPEALDMVQAASTGHEGGLSTVHAGTPQEAVTVRLPTMIASGSVIAEQQAKVQVNLGIELVIQLKISPNTHKQMIDTITEVVVDTSAPQHAEFVTILDHSTSRPRLVAGRVAEKLNAIGGINAIN